MTEVITKDLKDRLAMLKQEKKWINEKLASNEEFKKRAELSKQIKDTINKILNDDIVDVDQEESSLSKPSLLRNSEPKKVKTKKEKEKDKSARFKDRLN